jgi:hypothetical protein
MSLESLAAAVKFRQINPTKFALNAGVLVESAVARIRWLNGSWPETCRNGATTITAPSIIAKTPWTIPVAETRRKALRGGAWSSSSDNCNFVVLPGGLSLG